MLPRRRRAGDGRELCFVWFLCVHARGVLTSCPKLTPFFLTAGDQCELVGHAFDPIKLHKPTMHKLMVISDAINAREPIREKGYNMVSSICNQSIMTLMSLWYCSLASIYIYGSACIQSVHTTYTQ